MYIESSSQRIVILFGPPGAGKGTQAEYLAERLGFFHFETSKIIQDAFANHGDDEAITVDGIAYAYRDERSKFFSGILNTPAVVSFWVKDATRRLHAQGNSIVFSGSPRTAFEAEELFPFFIALVGSERCRLLHLDVPLEVSLARNTQRLLCAVCRLPHRSGLVVICRRCGGELKRREGLDEPETIRVRWKEFTERTLPVLDVARSCGIEVAQINANHTEEKVWNALQQSL